MPEKYKGMNWRIINNMPSLEDKSVEDLENIIYSLGSTHNSRTAAAGSTDRRSKMIEHIQELINKKRGSSGGRRRRQTKRRHAKKRRTTRRR
jgi:hypothetical protein